MGNDYLLNPVIFLVDTLFGLYILVVMLRFMLQMVRADFYNPFSQFLVKATSPLLRPMRRIIPGWGGIDVSSLLLLLILQTITIVIMILLIGGNLGSVSIAGLLMASVTKLVSLALYVYLFCLIILAVLSWVSAGGGYNPVAALISSITAPLLRPIRKLIPPAGMLDFSVLIGSLVLVIARMLIMPPLQELTVWLGFPRMLISLI